MATKTDITRWVQIEVLNSKLSHRVNGASEQSQLFSLPFYYIPFASIYILPKQNNEVYLKCMDEGLRGHTGVKHKKGTRTHVT